MSLALQDSVDAARADASKKPDCDKCTAQHVPEASPDLR